MVRFKNKISGKIMMVADSRAEEYRKAGFTEVSENPAPAKPVVIEEPKEIKEEKKEVVKKAPAKRTAAKTTKKK